VVRFHNCPFDGSLSVVPEPSRPPAPASIHLSVLRQPPDSRLAGVPRRGDVAARGLMLVEVGSERW
jgi:hypothetical protein